jgi:hypothetical protein
MPPAVSAIFQKPASLQILPPAVIPLPARKFRLLAGAGP